MRDENTTDLIRHLGVRPDLASLVDGMDIHVRTATAHTAIEYRDDSIMLETRTGDGRTYGLFNLADIVFRAYESSLACLIGLRVAILSAGIQFNATADLTAFGLTPLESLKVGVAALSGGAVDALERGDTWAFSLSNVPNEGLTHIVCGIGALAPPEQVKFIEFHVMNESGNHIYCGPVSAILRWREAPQGLAADTAIVRLLHEWNYDDRPVMAGPQIRQWVGVRAVAALDVDLKPSGSANSTAARLRKGPQRHRACRGA